VRLLWLVATAALAATLEQPALAHEAALSAEESAALDAVIDPVLAAMRGTSSRQAIADFFDTAGPGGLAPDKLDQLAEPVEGVLERSGPVTHCVRFDEQLRSPLVVKRRYLCQHRSGVSHWEFILVRLPIGWAAKNLSFSTAVDELFDSGERD
jgi:hypothetical protein